MHRGTSWHRLAKAKVSLCCRVLLLGAVCSSGSSRCYAQESGTELAALYQQQVDRQLRVPEAEQARYAMLLGETLTRAGLGSIPAQYVSGGRP
jgi:hypothetical protein